MSWPGFALPIAQAVTGAMSGDQSNGGAGSMPAGPRITETGNITGSSITTTGPGFGAWPFSATPGQAPGTATATRVAYEYAAPPATVAGLPASQFALYAGAALVAVLLLRRKRGRR